MYHHLPCSAACTMAAAPPLLLLLLLHLLLVFVIVDVGTVTVTGQSSLCRPNCGPIPIRYPFSLGDGCGSPYFRRLLICSPSSTLHLRTPSGTYPVSSISYSPDPHLVVSDPSMWACSSSSSTGSSSSSNTLSSINAPPFSLDSSTHLSLSPKNEFLFLNCSPSSVLLDPKPRFCERFPDRCGTSCDSAGYLCRNPPRCPEAFRRATTCCTYFPEGSESVRLMLRRCEAYASVFWREVAGGFPPYEQVAEYGVRVDFEVPVTTRCLRCEDGERGSEGGVCGFDVATREFRCLCRQGNTTTHCRDDGAVARNKTMTGVIVGTTTAISVFGLATAGVIMWYIRKLKTSKVSCGVQSNENRLF